MKLDTTRETREEREARKYRERFLPKPAPFTGFGDLTERSVSFPDSVDDGRDNGSVGEGK